MGVSIPDNLSIGNMVDMPENKKVQAKPPVRIKLVFASGEMEVRAALRELKLGLGPMQLADADFGTVELVVGEVLNNVVEHAYGPGSSGPIVLACTSESGVLRFCVCDRGRTLPGLQLPVGRRPDVNRPRSELPEGGFGWYLVHSLAFDLKYRRAEQSNILNFSIQMGETDHAK